MLIINPFLCSSFNPCFHGSTTVSRIFKKMTGYKPGFQSLFSWKYNCEENK
ncbi:Uncharacterized protein dnl_30540 [Desulfonema limicola]|uniref:Uncharacterized protein n=1 Tax=Desulfonema limicola TaxID=45656 RepID=A0A975GGV9_9BACT|nr:Uncharacterized protein dnl_30540 [Desulfonema limicola]